MSRFLPAQIQRWTAGRLIVHPEHVNQSEHFYRGISTDTRSLRAGEIFLALRGKHFDGHAFARKACELGAGMLVLEESHPESQGYMDKISRGEPMPDLLLVKSSLKAYQEIAKGYRQTLLANVIAITGSVGKTTTRRMVTAAIESQTKIHETEDNKNNEIGVPLTLLQADDEDDLIVAELAMDRRGEIKVLSDLCLPDISIITSIGYSHAEYLGSREDIFLEKTQITSGMRSNGLVLINGQDEQLNRWALEHMSHRSIWRVCNEEIPTARELATIPCFWAEAVRVHIDQTCFIARCSFDKEIALPVCIPAPGRYVVRAALFALAAAYALGLDMRKAAASCSGFANTGSRQQIVKVQDVLLLDDSYNASPESMRSALDTLELLGEEGSRRIACLGGMRELGKYAASMHREIGRKIAKMQVDAVYLTGEEGVWIAEGMQEAKAEAPFYHCADAKAIAEALLPRLRAKDVVLLKGSRSYALEQVREAMEGAVLVGGFHA